MKYTPFILLFCLLVGCKPTTEVYSLSSSPREQARSEKRGVSYGFSMPDVDAALLGGATSWFYNWGPSISDNLNSLATLYKMDFYPMAWNGSFDADKIRAYKLSHPECDYILGFNEPNLTDQCNLTPSQAAVQWAPLQQLAAELGMKLVAPAMNYGTLEGYHDPIVWLDEFFTLVPLESIDVIAIHCYMGNASSMKSYVDRFKKYGKPIWMTEFCGWESFISSPEAQARYMSEAINYLEAEPAIERYAWFIPRSSGAVDSYPYMQLLTKDQPYELTALGKIFVNMSTLDKSVYALADTRIEAEHFTAGNLEEALSQNTWAEPVHFAPTTDTDGVLQIEDLTTDKWVEYQIETKESGSHALQIRYAAFYNVTITLSIDGVDQGNIVLASTGDTDLWNTTSIPIDLTPGKHTLRITSVQYSCAINWLSFSKS